MAQLIVRKLEDKVVRKLKERAASRHLTEEAHRRILRDILLKPGKPKMTFNSTSSRRLRGIVRWTSFDKRDREDRRIDLD